MAAYTRPGRLVSVIVPNPAGMVLRQLVTEGPGAALAELDADTKRAVTFDHPVRTIPMGELAGRDPVGRRRDGHPRDAARRKYLDLLP